MYKSPSPAAVSRSYNRSPATTYGVAHPQLAIMPFLHVVLFTFKPEISPTTQREVCNVGCHCSRDNS